ncbi:MAG: 50S ribosomal protein L10 [Elusimicrobia bacterium]|nr:50S ribosomal protein L10 [Elusimicrobiota bacterium]
MNKKEKAQVLDDLTACLTHSPISLFATFKGVKTPELFEAKKKIKAEKAAFQIVKKSLLKKAFQTMGIEAGSTEFWKGEIAALTSSNGDPVRLTKLLAQWGEQNKNIGIKGGFMLADKQWLDRKTIEIMAKLPGAKDLQAKLVGTLAAPLAHLAGVLNAVTVNFVLVLKALEENNKKSQATA